MYVVINTTELISHNVTYACIMNQKVAFFLLTYTVQIPVEKTSYTHLPSLSQPLLSLHKDSQLARSLPTVNTCVIHKHEQ